MRNIAAIWGKINFLGVFGVKTHWIILQKSQNSARYADLSGVYATQILSKIHYNISQKMIEITQNTIYYHAKKDKNYQKLVIYKAQIISKIKKKIQHFSKFPKICSKKMAKSTIKMSKKYSNMTIYGNHSFKYIL